MLKKDNWNDSDCPESDDHDYFVCLIFGKQSNPGPKSYTATITLFVYFLANKVIRFLNLTLPRLLCLSFSWQTK